MYAKKMLAIFYYNVIHAYSFCACTVQNAVQVHEDLLVAMTK